MRKTILFLLVAVTASFASITMKAQDILIKKDFTSQQVNVVEIGDDYVVYKDYNNPTGPNIRVSASQIGKLTLKNGQVVEFKTPQTRTYAAPVASAAATETVKEPVVYQKEPGFSNFHFSYVPATFKTSAGTSSEKTNLNGFNLGYAYAIPLWRALFLELGLDLDATFYSKTTDEVKMSDTFMDLRIPLTLMYKFRIPTTKTSIIPLAGFDFGAFVLGQEKYSYTGGSETVNFFDEKTMGLKMSRFIFDWHIGLKFMFNDKVTLGYTYQGPISSMYQNGNAKITYAQHLISIGFCF